MSHCCGKMPGRSRLRKGDLRKSLSWSEEHGSRSLRKETDRIASTARKQGAMDDKAGFLVLIQSRTQPVGWQHLHLEKGFSVKHL